MWTMLRQEFLHDLRHQKTRVFLTVAGIVWGTMSVVLLLAFGFGLERRILEGNLNYSDAVVTVRAGETTVPFQGLPAIRAVTFTMDDVHLLRENLPLVQLISPSFGQQGMIVSRGAARTTTFGEGVAPDFFHMRHFYQGQGRFLNDADVIEKRRVVFLGDNIAQTLFADEDPVGQLVEVDGLPYKVVGVLAKKVQMSMSNGPDADRVIMPWSTFQTVYGQQRLHRILIRPADRERTKELIRDVRDLLGRRYRFDPADEYAVGIEDDIENEKIGRRIMLGLNIFFGVIGSLTLVVAGVGVANIMFVVVKERTNEIGIKRALGARRRAVVTPFLVEALLITAGGGLLGSAVSWGLVAAVSTLPDDSGPLQMMGHPVLSGEVAAVTVIILAVIALLAGVLPAHRAAQIDPIEALRYE
jgi:putative ABC transport system permease protein